MSRHFAWTVPTVLLTIIGMAAVGLGQNESVDAGAVVIRRELLRLTSPETYRLALQLEPVKKLVLVAPCDGTVQSVDTESGKSVNSQESLVRMSATERQLMLDRSLALLKVAELEVEQAKKTKQAIELAEARLHAAQADAKLLQFQADQLMPRAPFAGTVLKVHVQAGQVVKAGEPLVTLADLTQLFVEVPIDRTEVKEGTTLKLRIENQTLDARVQKVLPADPKFEKMRDLAESLATAVIVLDNSAGNWHVGQSVFAALVPSHPVSSVPTKTVGTKENGQRKVQVVRQGMVNDVEVDLLAHVGTERVIVSGAFIEGDQLILSVSRELADGTQLRPNPTAALPARIADPANGAVAKPNDNAKNNPSATDKKKPVSGF